MVHRRTILALMLGIGGTRTWGGALVPEGKKTPKVAIVGTADVPAFTEMKGGALEALAESALLRCGVVGVVRRSDLPEQFKEIKLSEQGLVPALDRKALGKLKVADYLLSIQPIRAEAEETSLMVPDVLNGGQKKIERYRAEATFAFRFTHVETGDVLSALTRSGDTDTRRAAAIDKVLRDCFKQLEDALVRGAKGGRSSLAPVPVSLVREDYIRVPLGSNAGLASETILQLVEELKDGEYTDYKVIGAARPREVFADNAKLEVGKLGRKNRFQRDDKLLKTLKIPGTLVRFAPLEGESKPSEKDGITRSLDLWGGLK